jgi:large subunit ribosomal protein L21
MYAIVKTGGKQYKVSAGDFLNVEKLDAEAGDKVALEAIAVVDGDKVEADPAKAGKTKVEAVVVEQFKGEKQLIFKFKKRKNYKRTRGHRQNLTRLQIVAVGSEKVAQ